MDIAQKIWGFCNVLKHDGINYGDYIEQLTYLYLLLLAVVSFQIALYFFNFD